MISAITSIKIYNPVNHPYYSNADKSSIEFPITDQCERSAKVMGEDFVRLQFKLKDRVTFDAFSFIEYDNQTFFLREQYIPTPNGTYYTYDIKFVSVANMLDKHVCYRHVKVTGAGEWYEPEININGTLDTMYVIVMGSIKRAAEQFKDIVYGQLLSTIYTNGMAADGINPNYSKVKITANTDLQTFNFSGDNIANVCTIIANKYTNDNKKDTEWYITEEHGASPDLTQLTLHFAKCQGDEDKLQEFSDYVSKDNGAYAFAHPYITGGLRKVEYAQAWSGITNVIIPYGSDRNMAGQSVKGIDDITKLQSTFGKRLRLEIYDKEGNPKTYKVIDKDGKEQEITINEQGGIRNDFVNTGIEQVKFFDEVYPQAHFQVKEVITKNKRQDGQIVPEYTIHAVALNNEGEEISTALLPDGFFPLQIEEGTTLSVRFESGLLNGREFEIANKTKSDMVDIEGEEKREYSLIFTIVADGSIEDGTLIPSGNFIPHIDDKFALFNMKMPNVYVELAQQELAQKAYEELVKIQTTRPEVKCSSDPTNFNGQMSLGGVVAIRSELFNSEGNEFKSRIISYSYRLTKPMDVQFSLASAIMQGTLSTMNDLIADVTHATGGLDQRTINLSRRAWRDATEMAEMLDSLKAEMLLVGEEKFQFAFSSAIQCMHENNAFVGLEVSAGTMQHTQEPYINYSNGGFWGIGYVLLSQDEAGNPLKADTPYYVYAKVEDAEYAEIVLNENAYSNEIGKDEPYLMLGILSSEFEGERIFNRTNGFTQITGGTITTEQIQDAGRNLIIDFQSNPPRIIARNKAEIVGNIKFLSADGYAQTLNEAIGVIGGRNLLESTSFHYDYKAGEKVAFTMLYTLDAGQKYIATYGKFEDNAGAANEWARGVCLVVSQSPSTELIEQVVKFGKPFEVNGNGRYLYIAWGVYEYMNSVKGSTSDEYVSNNFTQYLDQVMLQEGEIATEFQEPISQHDYLTKVLTDGSTEIEGGLVMTNVLALKDIQVNPDGTTTEQVTAGVSGVKDDNVLMWGGGTYEEAINAASADNDFHVGENKTGRQITSLLKKDGQGKIGIFRISDTQAIVKTNQGEVLIDATDDNGGVFVNDKDGQLKAAVVTRSVDEYMPEYYKLSDPIEYSGNGKVTQYSYKTLIEFTVYEGFAANLKIEIGGYFEGKHQQLEHDMAIYGYILIHNNNDFRKDIYSEETLTPAGESYTRFDIEGKDIILNNLEAGKYVVECSISRSGVTVESLTDYISIVGTLTQETIAYPTPHTIIGVDGVLSIYSAKQFFKVQNTESGQKIYAKGLSDGADRTEGSGELYVSSDFIKAFKEFLTYMKTWVEDVRSIGSNEEKAETMKGYCDAVMAKLTETSLIANS